MASILNQIDNTDGIVFIYTNYVDAGIIPLQLMLEHNGYRRFEKKMLSFPEYKSSVDKHKCNILNLYHIVCIRKIRRR